MKSTIILLAFCILIARHSAGSKNEDISIHKVWSFSKYDVVNVNINKGAGLGASVGLNFLDLTNADSLTFIYESNRAVLPYQISRNKLMVQMENKPFEFTIWKLTTDELVLLAQGYKLDQNGVPENAIGLFFKAKLN